MNIVFMGTPDFAVPALKALIENYDVKAVYTQPDRPKGRGKKLAFSAVKEVAVEHNIPVFQPIKIKTDAEAINELKKISPDFIIVVAFGQILPKEILEIPKYACINLHASLLPKYRGAAPINWAVINGEKKSGNTTMLMDVGLDTGDMLLRSETIIHESMTAGELHDILMDDGAKLLIKTIEGMVNNEIKPEAQDSSLSCYASMLNKEIAKINWSESASTINNLIRGLNPRPVAYTTYNDLVMKIYKAEPVMRKHNKVPGEIIEVSNNGILVACGEGMLMVKLIQFPGGKALGVEDYIKGNSIEVETILK
jgi:methionyl-tRNA formyltransferase